MEEAANDQPSKPRGKGGRQPKSPQDKASELIGPWWLTPAQKQEYDKLFKASRLKNQAEFFRQIIFSKSLKLYYSDENSERIYAKLLEIQSELRRIGHNYNKAVKALNTVYKDNIKASEEAEKLVELTNQTSAEFKRIIALFQDYKAKSTDQELGGGSATDKKLGEKGNKHPRP